jgi:MFS family permease
MDRPSPNGLRRWPADLTALQHRNYRLLWIGTLASFAMNPIQFSGGALFLTNSASDDLRLVLVGLLGAMRGGALLCVGLGGGALADRLDRRKLLLAMQAVVIVATLGTALAMSFGASPAALVAFFVLAFVAASAQSVDMPTRQAMVHDVVPRHHLANAVALDSVAMMLALPVSLPIAGVLIDWLGYSGAYACSAVGYAVVFAAAFRIDYKRAAAVPVSRRLLAEIGDGINYVRGSPPIMWMLILLFTVMALGFPLVAAFGPVWVTEVLDLSATEFGFFAAAWGLGAITASVVMTNVGHFPRKGWLMATAAVAFAAWVVVWAHSRSVPLSALTNFGLGASITVAQISTRSLIQRAVPGELQGRVLSLFLVNQAISLLSALPVGALAQATSLETTTLVVGWLTVALALTIVLSRKEIARTGLLAEPALAPGLTR